MVDKEVKVSLRSAHGGPCSKGKSDSQISGLARLTAGGNGSFGQGLAIYGPKWPFKILKGRYVFLEKDTYYASLDHRLRGDGERFCR
jgi:hypothetical protein